MPRAIAVLFAVGAALYASNGEAARVLSLQPLSFAWNSPVRTPQIVIAELPLVFAVDWREWRGGGLGWTFELTPAFGHGFYRGVEYQSRRMLSSVGLTIRERDDGGFFATPKVFGVMALEGEGSLRTLLRRSALDQVSSQFSIGADVGYEWRFEQLVIAVVGGVSAGTGANVREVNPADILTASLVAMPLSGIRGARRAQRPVMDVNLNLLRIGVPF